ncbi:hypothetical protein ACM25P_07170 [Vreelandella alkaliphila]
MEERAKSVDEVFDEKVLDGKTLREIIKSWVDKRVVHMDFLWDDDEVIHIKRIEWFIFGGGMNNLLFVLLKLIAEYEEVVARFGENAQDQLHLVLSEMTGGVQEGH